MILLTRYIWILFILTSCGGRDNSRFFDFLKINKISTDNSAVVVMNPSFCGACTNETVDWIVEYDKKNPDQQKYLLKTSELNEAFLKRINETKFKQILVSAEKIERLGFGGAVSKFIRLEDDEIAENKVIKSIPE